ncbi:MULTISPECIES: dihydrodipicolinate synthase family protein [unclassified Saccharopolyspora]|uniref:dihydrodipicolinate synthase family protein n=1 Tax=unclassified Saccharopolyspora TaxID=2646250 RepID=UPI001CD5E8F1|nr:MULTISPECIES: dihydrodipicolinate synthase family protein [unclassified Saccharopolyspora]MCA1189743.1 dihydrodipicolinate synthase family protein [Saccharopolyspora sp. 6T]MCA1193968.1 dihydrodipicolinate synthase family protein [Saccharopolyspora sp. 6V]MCA1228664.1 dihydrodipicolinate synthase family protein [Saccharopolyspora sp. 6M]
MFTGLSAFPLTPVTDRGVDEAAFAGLVERLATAPVDSITALGSTGSYPYLDRAERARVARLAVRHAGDVPVLVGIGALRTREVLALAEDAQEAGAAGVLLAPVSYQALTDEEVFGLYADVTAALSVPLVVYDNPGTTHVTFTDELHALIAALPNVASVKIPGVPEPVDRVSRLRGLLPEPVTIGVAGDPLAAEGILAGCRAWYSVLAGTVPEAAAAIARPAFAGDAAAATAESDRLAPLWELFGRCGSLRVVSAIAEELGLVAHPNLPRPVLGLPTAERAEVARLVDLLDLRR